MVWDRAGRGRRAPCEHPPRHDGRVPDPNRVTPFGQIEPIDQRGLLMGNRGCLHRQPREIARPWQVRRWITCVLEHKGWVAPRWEPGRWTPLFFWDEAVALAAGHRPCALCRRPAFTAWIDAWEAAFGDRPRVDPMDRRMHADRVDGRAQRRHRASWCDLPAGTFVALPPAVTGALAAARTGAVPGRAAAHPAVADDVPALVLDDRLVPWSVAGYGPPVDRPARGDATVLTPQATVEVVGHGYRPAVHPSASPSA